MIELFPKTGVLGSAPEYVLPMKNAVPDVESWVQPLRRFATWLRSADRPESTIYLRLYHLRRFAADTLVAPECVTYETLVEYLGDHQRHDWQPATRQAVRASLRSFYRWAYLVDHLMTLDPAAMLPSRHPPGGVPRPAAEDVVAQAIAAADDRVRLMLLLGSRAGLRCCEICKVHSDDLFPDLDGWSLLVVGKGGKRRMVPLSKAMALELRACPPGYLFPGNVRGHLSASYVSKLVSAGLPDGVTAHMLRHRYATKVYQDGGKDLRAVQQLLGHASVATTQIYTLVPDSELRTAAAAAA